MENQTPITNPPVTNAPPQVPVVPYTNWIKISLLIVLVLILIGGSVFVGIQIGKNQPGGNNQLIRESSTVINQDISPTATANIPTTTPSAATDVTANWQTYTNTENGYVVKYPTDKFVRLVCPKEELTLIKRQPNDTRDIVNMETCSRGGRYSLEVVTLASDNRNIPQSDEYYNITKQEIIVDGNKATRYKAIQIKELQGPGLDWTEQVHINYNGKTFVIYSGVEEYSQVLNQIITTFKFLK